MKLMVCPLFTVITANYNSGEKLAATVESVRQQHADAEHWIIDGASTDGSLPLARRFADERPDAVRLISRPDRGVYDAMNTGIAKAAGRYLYFVGAGDTLHPDVLNRVAKLLPDHDRGFVYGDAMHGDHLYDGPFDRRRLVHRNICHQAAFYGRDIFAILGMYDPRYKAYADWEFNLRCFGDRRIRPQYVSVTVADFEPGGISGRGDDAFRRDRLRILLRNYGPLATAAVLADDLLLHPLRFAKALVGRSAMSAGRAP